MASPNQSLYPKIPQSNPNTNSPSLSPNPKSPLYPSIDMKDLENLFPDADADSPALPPPAEETLLRIPGAILHLIDPHRSVELAAGEFAVLRLVQGASVVAVLARVGQGDRAVQWPLARDEASVRLDDSHYFFSLHVPGTGDDESEGVLNYGLTFAAKGQEDLLVTLDGVLYTYSSFSFEEVGEGGKSSVLDGSAEKEVAPAEVAGVGAERDLMERRSEVYWTTIAPNVEDYSGSVAKAIARGSGQVIRGILWCGDVTVERLRWGEEMLKRRTSPCSEPTEVSKDALKRMKRFELFGFLMHTMVVLVVIITLVWFLISIIALVKIWFGWLMLKC